jgi:hypothetical protein
LVQILLNPRGEQLLILAGLHPEHTAATTTAATLGLIVMHIAVAVIPALASTSRPAM